MRTPLAVLLTSMLALQVSAQRSQSMLRGRVLHIEGPDGRMDLELPCRSRAAIRVADRTYVATRCGVVRVELTRAGLNRVHTGLRGQSVREVRVEGGFVVAELASPRGRVVRIERVVPPDEFTDPDADPFSAQLPERGEHLVVRIWQPPSGPALMDPPRQEDRWSLGASLFSFVPVASSGLGLITRAHLAYASTLPLSVRADLMPLGYVWSSGGNTAGVLGLVGAELDTHVVGFGVAAGGVSNNEHDPYSSNIEPDAMLVAAPTLRIGVTDGLHLIVRAGVALGGPSARFGFFQSTAQIPLTHDLALSLAFDYGLSGNIEVRAGLRLWMIGRGQAGSLALTFDGGGSRLQYRGPWIRDRGYPPTVDHFGPGVGLGVEARL